MYPLASFRILWIKDKNDFLRHFKQNLFALLVEKKTDQRPSELRLLNNYSVVHQSDGGSDGFGLVNIKGNF
jgi:hypothetical protein